MKNPIARGLTLVALLTCLMVPIAHAKKQPDSWDGLSLKKVKGLDAVYVRPDVVFTAYKSVMLDKVQVEFAKNWQKDVNSNRTGFKNKPTAEEMQEIKDVSAGDGSTLYAFSVLDDPPSTVGIARVQLFGPAEP